MFQTVRLWKSFALPSGASSQVSAAAGGRDVVIISILEARPT